MLFLAGFKVAFETQTTDRAPRRTYLLLELVSNIAYSDLWSWWWELLNSDPLYGADSFSLSKYGKGLLGTRTVSRRGWSYQNQGLVKDEEVNASPRWSCSLVVAVRGVSISLKRIDTRRTDDCESSLDKYILCLLYFYFT